MNETIYCKELPENPECLKMMLKTYFELECPKTYYSNTDFLQCDSGRSRSVDDLLLLSNHYFPGTTIQQMMAAYREINEEYNKENEEIIFSVCSTIERIKLNNNKFNKGDYKTVNMIYINGLDNVAEKSQWTMRELAEMKY